MDKLTTDLFRLICTSDLIIRTFWPLTFVSIDRLFFREFLSPTARDPVNVDCHVAESVRQNVETSCDRCCFDVAVVSLHFCSVPLTDFLLYRKCYIIMKRKPGAEHCIQSHKQLPQVAGYLWQVLRPKRWSMKNYWLDGCGFE